MTEQSKKGLGKGLAALIGDISEKDENEPKNSEPSSVSISNINEVPVEFLHPNKDQPRKFFDKDTINELAESIRQKGLILPILVKEIDKQHYQIIAGERRWRASQKAGLHNVPVIVKNLSQKEILEVALIENMQREDLNPIEEAMGMSQLQKEHKYTQEELASVLGKSRPQIANTLRLLTLPHKVQEFVQKKILSAGHVRALVGNDNSYSIAKYAIKKNMSVRQLENYISYIKKRKTDKKNTKSLKDPNILSLEKDLNNILGLRVKIDYNKNEKGKIQFFYENLDQFNGLIKKIKK